MTEKLLGVENQLRGVQEEQQKTAGKLQEISEKNKVLESENRQLKSENDRLTSLNLNFEQKGLARENESLKAQIAHLESALQSDLSERGSFLEHMSQDKENLVRAEHEIKELKEKLISLQQELQNANTKLNVYDKAGLLKLPDKDPTLLPPRVSAPSPKEFEKLREAHSELQLLYREKSRELEQLSVTLSSHSTTYQALQTQVSKVTQESAEKEKLMSMTIRSLEDTIKRRDERCEKLETQILTLTDKGMREQLEDLGPPSLTQTVGLGKHDNLLEFHIDRVVFELSEFTHLKTFVSWTVPFSLEDPLQHTNVARGTEPHYNYSALYKFQVNNRNLMSLKEDTVTASVYILLDSGHPAKVGECGLTFQEILDHPRNTLHGTVPVVLVHDDADEAQHLDFIANNTPGQVIGSMSYWFRLQRPSEGAIAQYLRTSGRILAAQKSHPKTETRAPKSITSPVEKKSMSKEVDDRLEDVQTTKEEKELHREAPHISTPIHSNSPLPLDKNNSSTRKHESPKSPRDNTKGRIISSDSPSSQTNSEVHQSITTDLIKHQLAHSRSASVSSSKSKGEKTKKSKSNSDTDDDRRREKSKLKRVDSEGSSEGSSPGTYNVESPKMSKESGNSTTDTSKTLKNKKPKRYESESSSPSQPLRQNSKSEKSSSSHNESVSSKSSSHGREKGNVEVADVKPSTSKMSSALPAKLSPQMGSNSPSRSQVLSSDESPDTSLDEEVNSDASHTHTSEDVVSQRKNDHTKIYIEVASLTLWPDCGVLQDPMVELIFVDFHGFLGLPPDQLETPISMSKNSPGNTLHFSFGQEFSIDKKEFPSRYQALSELMGGRGILKFTITSEPSEEMQDTHDCQDLGYAYVDLHEVAREGEDLVDGMLSVESAEDGNQIGVLKMTTMNYTSGPLMSMRTSGRPGGSLVASYTPNHTHK